MRRCSAHRCLEKETAGDGTINAQAADVAKPRNRRDARATVRSALPADALVQLEGKRAQRRVDGKVACPKPVSERVLRAVRATSRDG